MNFLKDSRHGHETNKKVILLYFTEFKCPKDFQNLAIDLKPDHILKQNSSRLQCVNSDICKTLSDLSPETWRFWSPTADRLNSRKPLANKHVIHSTPVLHIYPVITIPHTPNSGADPDPLGGHKTSMSCVKPQWLCVRGWPSAVQYMYSSPCISHQLMCLEGFFRLGKLCLEIVDLLFSDLAWQIYHQEW